MSIRTVLVSATLVFLCGVVSSQPVIPPAAPAVPPPSAPSVPAPTVPPRLDFSPPTAPGVSPPWFVVPVAPPVPVTPIPPPEKTVEDLLNELERVQAQKAELEKKEQDLKATVRGKLEKQAERLNKLGVTPKPAKMAEPDRVGRVIIEGNTKTPDKQILDMMSFRPGQVLQYPALEAARAKLVKVGFEDATIEVIRNELDPTLKDIRVRVIEPKPELAPAPRSRGF